MATTERAWLLPREAARRLGVSSKTISRWAREGKLEFTVTLGGHRRFDPAKIDAIADLLADDFGARVWSGAGTNESVA